MTELSGQRAVPDDQKTRPDDQPLPEPMTGSGGHNQESVRKDSYQDDDRAGEVSSALPSDLVTAEDEATWILDDLADRLGWPKSGKLTSRERRHMHERLQDCGGLPGWQRAMSEAERSNYLRRTKPDIRFFLNADNFAQLMRGRYAPEHDPPVQRSKVSAAIAGLLAAKKKPSDDDFGPCGEGGSRL